MYVLVNIPAIYKYISADDLNFRPIFMKLTAYAHFGSMSTLQLEFLKNIKKQEKNISR
jgi:hypothetical protein